LLLALAPVELARKNKELNYYNYAGVHLENLLVSQLFNKFSALYPNQKLVIVRTKAHH
jgi:hypothetical protein